jgi:hypothetical protein
MNTDSGSMNAERPAVPLRVDHGDWHAGCHTGVPCPACGAGIVYNGNYHCSKYVGDAPECTWVLSGSNDTDPMFQRCYAGLMDHRPHVRVSWAPGTLEWRAHLMTPGVDPPDVWLCSSPRKADVLANAAGTAEMRGIPVYEVPIPPPPADNAELPEHDVAVLVFARVRAVDYGDGAGIAQRAVAAAIRDGMKTVYGAHHEPFGELTYRSLRPNARIPVVIAEVRDLDLCLGDSSVRIVPTSKPYRRLDESRARWAEDQS